MKSIDFKAKKAKRNEETSVKNQMSQTHCFDEFGTRQTLRNCILFCCIVFCFPQQICCCMKYSSSVFNREYPWSPSCKELNAYAWVDAQIKTGEYETVKEIIEVPQIGHLLSLNNSKSQSSCNDQKYEPAYYTL